MYVFQLTQKGYHTHSDLGLYADLLNFKGRLIYKNLDSFYTASRKRDIPVMSVQLEKPQIVSTTNQLITMIKRQLIEPVYVQGTK
jgi:hypothetical protein